MEVRRVIATRSNLLKAGRRLERVRKGIDLLQQKRNALVSELFRRGRPAIEARADIEREARLAYRALLGALATQGWANLTALGWPTREITVDVEITRVWGLEVPSVSEQSAWIRTLGARGTAPGTTGPSAVEAARHFERFGEMLVDAAPLEQVIRRLAQALADTTRQVNTLEQRVATALDHQLVHIRRTLEEREREEQARLRHLLKLRRPLPVLRVTQQEREDGVPVPRR
jgi:H(+)-transporting ATP synthase subunit D